MNSLSCGLESPSEAIHGFYRGCAAELGWFSISLSRKELATELLEIPQIHPHLLAFPIRVEDVPPSLLYLL